jgi:CHRD domain
MIGRRLGISLAVAAFVPFAVGSYAVAGPRDGPGKVPNSKKFEARLSGFQETPSISSTGFGNFEAELVTPTKLHYVFSYGGLEGGTSLFAHVHFGQRSVAGGVSFFLCGGSTKPAACPNVEGTVEGDVTAADIVGPNGQGIEPLSFGEVIRAMQAGHSYANIHTTRWPGGEIRGQINDKDQKEFDK